MSIASEALEAPPSRRRMLYPWQWATALANLPVTQVIASGFDTARMSAELAEAGRTFKLGPQQGPHHNGLWDRVGLVAPDGDPGQSYLRRGQVMAKTPVLRAMPYIESIIDGLDAPLVSASVSVMQPGARVRWHRDPSYSVDLAIVRLHLPIDTTPAATLELGHELSHWTAGQLWYGDFSFPHRVVHDGPKPRTHIMIDIEAASARRLFTDEYLAAAHQRRIARGISVRIFDHSERLHPAGRYAARFRKQREEWRRSGDGPPPPM